jgi:hypothetical protein
MMTEVTTGFAKSHVSERRAGLHSFGFAIWPVQPFNRRGITTQMPTDGGGQERDEAAKYRSDAKASALLWPRTLTVLERTAAGYEADPEREDQSAEQKDWGTEW